MESCMICGVETTPDRFREIKLGLNFRIFWGIDCSNGCDSKTVIEVLAYGAYGQLNIVLLDREDREAIERYKGDVLVQGGFIVNEILIAPMILWALVGGGKNERGTREVSRIPDEAIKKLVYSVGPFSG